MSHKTYIDIDKWNRKEHFKFFNTFEEPFFGVVIPFDFTITYQKAKSQNHSFFLSYLYKTLVAANQIDAFKYRIEDGNKVALYDTLDASATIGRPDNTFGFSYIHYSDNFLQFEKSAQMEIQRIQNSTSLFPPINQQNCIYFSSLPWLNFTSLSHARNFKIGDSVPKISFGQLSELNGKKTMPVSIHLHHGLADGYHVGQFAELYQQVLNA